MELLINKLSLGHGWSVVAFVLFAAYHAFLSWDAVHSTLLHTLLDHEEEEPDLTGELSCNLSDTVTLYSPTASLSFHNTPDHSVFELVC